MKNKKTLIIFDLDGTLYELRGGSYKKSPLRKAVVHNAIKLIAEKFSKNKIHAKRLFLQIQKKYGEHLSIGFEKEFCINRYDYFNRVWDIPARGIVKKSKNIRKVLLGLKKNYNMIVVSDAPQVWIRHVLKELGIQDIFRNKIFSGEGDRRKGLNNAFQNIIKTLKTSPQNCIVIGDQEHTDIIPAKEIGMRTVFINKTKISGEADITIPSVKDLPKALEKISARC